MVDSLLLYPRVAQLGLEKVIILSLWLWTEHFLQELQGPQDTENGNREEEEEEEGEQGEEEEWIWNVWRAIWKGKICLYHSKQDAQLDDSNWAIIQKAPIKSKLWSLHICILGETEQGYCTVNDAMKSATNTIWWNVVLFCWRFIGHHWLYKRVCFTVWDFIRVFLSYQRTTRLMKWVIKAYFGLRFEVQWRLNAYLGKLRT